MDHRPIKLLKENVRENFHDLGLGKEFLDMAQETQ